MRERSLARRDNDCTSGVSGQTRFAVFALAATVLLVGSALQVAAVAAPAAGAATAGNANFEVRDLATNSPVEEGDTLATAATVENTGTTTGTQSIDLTVGGAVRDSTTVTLAPGEQTRVGLSWDTAEGDKGTYTATVASANDSASAEIEVTGNPHIVVQWLSSNAPVSETDTLNVSVKVANVGDGEGSDVVRLLLNGKLRDTREVNLSAGNSRDITLSWETGDGDAGEYNATVATRDDTTSRQLTVYDPGNFSVAIDETNAPVYAGEPLVVNATVANRARQQRTKTVRLTVGGSVRDSRSVSLAPGATAKLSLTWATGSGDAGNYTATVASPNTSDSTNVTVRSRPGDLRLVPGDTYYQGQVLFSSAFEAETNVVVRRNGTTVRTVRVDPDGLLVLETGDLSSGDYGLYGENHTRRFTLVEQTLSVTATPSAVKNRGTNTSTELTIASNRTAYEAVITSPQFDAAGLDQLLPGLDGVNADRDGDGTPEALIVPIDGETTTVADFTGLDAGTYTLQVDVADTTASEAVRIDVETNDPPTASIEPATPTAGFSVTITAGVTTDSPIESYEWTVDGEVVSESRWLTYTFESAGEHEVTVTVTDDTGSTATASRTIFVESAATPTDTPTATPTPTPTSGFGPGFGVLAAVLALLVAIGAHRRR